MLNNNAKVTNWDELDNLKTIQKVKGIRLPTKYIDKMNLKHVEVNKVGLVYIMILFSYVFFKVFISCAVFGNVLSDTLVSFKYEIVVIFDCIAIMAFVCLMFNRIYDKMTILFIVALFSFCGFFSYGGFKVTNAFTTMSLVVSILYLVISLNAMFFNKEYNVSEFAFFYTKSKVLYLLLYAFEYENGTENEGRTVITLLSFSWFLFTLSAALMLGWYFSFFLLVPLGVFGFCVLTMWFKLF
ncbi:hypothetical protein EIN_185210 [Entamoeba invadens IP1]|uniref:hypothetical protein n=1 Tax=Entamoeba invadens IP1 TaxID=370355 RepID=UPI0002C3E58A|nr:hypothetical protein EIN_185210 [Entamoeba invadens IP1]ELP94144.1 hypothetical protein EIN_185210 [Entamoeba invadens IP1]|eukprot:XP_004260915.1 hypothetical protein EIN_185210 [Entamoeba invadens IP1]